MKPEQAEHRNCEDTCHVRKPSFDSGCAPRMSSDMRARVCSCVKMINTITSTVKFLSRAGQTEKDDCIAVVITNNKATCCFQMGKLLRPQA